MKVILASNNKHKLEEIKKILTPLGYEVVSQAEAGVNIDVEELKGGITNGKMLYEFEGTPDEIADKCLKFVKDDLADFNVIVRLSGEGRTAQELLNASKVISSYGYSSFIIG